jgi:hypothetical protein
VSPDPNLTEELNALFVAEPPLRATPEQVLTAARGLRRRRQRIAVAGSAIGTVVLVGATAAAAAGLSGGPAPDRTADGNGGVSAPTASCPARTLVPPRLPPTAIPVPTRSQQPTVRPTYGAPSAAPAETPGPPVARPRATVPPPGASPAIPITPGAGPSEVPPPRALRRSDGPERTPTAEPPATAMPTPSAEPPATAVPTPSAAPPATAVSSAPATAAPTPSAGRPAPACTAAPTPRR